MFGPPSSALEDLLRRPRRTAWQEFCRSPLVFLACKLYSWRHAAPAAPSSIPVSVVCISDTHCSQPFLPDGDILIHAGDLTHSGSFEEIQAALTWLGKQPFEHKIVVAGNHDLLLDASRDAGATEPCLTRAKLNWGDIIYLEDTIQTIKCANGRHLRVYGSPKTPQNGNWAFQYPRSQDVWSKTVPDNVDILITHGPPRCHLDLLNLGCSHLLQELWRIHPRLHVFGHVHEGRGCEWLSFDDLQAAYERLVLAKGGFRNFLLVCKEFITSFLRPKPESTSLLVNPAIVSGLRDTERRRAIKVVI